MAKATKDRRSCIWEVRLKWLDSAVRYQFLLSEFGAALGATRGRIEATSGEGREPVVDAVFDYEWEVIEGMSAVVDYEWEAIEGMLGMSFVACQLDIISVVSRCLRFHELGPELLGPKPSKQDLRELCRETVTGSAFSKVTAVNAFANYFKHEDEWPVDWRKIKPKSLAAETAGIVLALGVVPGSCGNMRTGVERILGHTKYERVGELGDLIGKWARGVKGEYTEKLKKKKLLLDI
jgi:hypothetical protein